MGGYGSGRRYDAKKTTESQCEIDVRRMKRDGALVPGAKGNISWSRRGEETSSIGYRVEAKRLIINYYSKQNGGEWESIEQIITLTWTYPNYGGKRIWFMCPQCNRRIAVLYGGKYFLCRRCRNLTYSSQQESKEDRLMRRARNIRCRLGGGVNLLEPFPLKPRNMHWETYMRLRQEAEIAHHKSLMLSGERWKFFK